MYVHVYMCVCVCVCVCMCVCVSMCGLINKLQNRKDWNDNNGVECTLIIIDEIISK